MDFDFELLNAKAAHQLRATALLVERAGKPSRTSWNIPFSDLTGSRLDEITDEITLALGKKCRSLYTFRLPDECSPEKVREMILQARGVNPGNRAYPRVNPVAAGRNSRCLYVGTSRKTAARVRQHLGAGNARTYALHLSWWATSLPGSVLLDIHEYGDDTPDEMLVVLEEQLARELDPVLGRRGSR
ncbi:hypothetical protein SAMN02927924_02678 [Sphingobium faniae]|nr:hypothetical protein SAMN02927924_02678 [Sphingobium faniae]